MTTNAPTRSAAASRDTGSDTVTQGIRVIARPFYLQDQSQPQEGKFAWGYRIRIANESTTRARLVSRHWCIVDGDGQRRDVEGEGVVGHQPDLAPGEFFEYTSYCPLECPWGTMEGEYTFEDPEGQRFEVRVGRFYLISPHV